MTTVKIERAFIHGIYSFPFVYITHDIQIFPLFTP